MALTAAAAAAASAAHPSPARADKHWNATVASGNWATPANWAENAVPVADDVRVFILFDDAADQTITYDGSHDSAVTSIYVRNAGAGTTTFQTAGAFDLAARAMFVGSAGTVGSGGNAAVVQTAGTHSFTGGSPSLTVGEFGGHGSYTLGGAAAALNLSHHLSLGEDGASGTLAASSGTFTHTAGAVSIGAGSGLFVGRSGVGRYDQSGGTVAAPFAILADTAGSLGSYTLGGAGSLQVTNLFLANAAASGTLAPSSATFTQDGGTVTAADVYVGYRGVGTYAHSGGTLNLTGGFASLRVGNDNGSAGTYLLGGDASVSVAWDLSLGLSANATLGPAAGTFVQSGGSVGVVNNLTVGYGGHGTYAHSGGTLTVGASGGNRELIVARNPGSQGRFTLSGDASVTAGSVDVGMLGGVVNSFGTFAPASGTFVQEGGTLAANAVQVGDLGHGTYAHSGGTLVAGSLRVGNFAGSTGSYSLSDNAVAAVNGQVIVGSQGASGTLAPAAGTFTHTGGTLTATGGMFVGASGVGGYDHSGGTVNVNGSSAFVVGNQSGAAGRYTLGGDASLNVAAFAHLGFTSGSVGTFTQTGGSFQAEALFVASGGTATYQQAGGTTTVRDFLRVGNGGSGVGSYTLSGGSLVVGTTGATRDFYLAEDGSGSFTLSGDASLSIGRDEWLGYDQGSGTFTQTGGTHAVARFLTIGRNGSGTYLHSGGSLTVNSTMTIRSGSTGAGSYTLSGTGSLNTPNLVVRGTLNWNGGSLSAPVLHVNAGGTMNLSPGGDKVLVVNSASVDAASGSKLDLADNKMIIRNADASYATYANLIKSAHNAGSWDGGGIATSMADAAAGLTTLAIAPATVTDYAGNTFGGLTVGPNDLLVMYTYGGDANLDGFVSSDDYSVIDFNIAVPGASGYSNGDFNYDGIISGDDYSVIDFNIVAQGAPFPAASAGSPQGVTAVPEPAACGSAILAASLLGRRRPCRRRRRRRCPPPPPA